MYLSLQDRELYLIFIVFQNAFDRVWLQCLWRVLHHYGIHPKLDQSDRKPVQENAKRHNSRKRLVLKSNRCTTRLHIITGSIKDIYQEHYEEATRRTGRLRSFYEWQND
ncbi:hypothetical protein DPMN_125439 [Dreissena polymorpha]|uniref:Reverse transcriptase n=1 Tax=Dreissena polymorpha TaxID=45954 RepID=A0A9D4GUF2_DREPO|nr:hypothetical protein DPMN_125439 [Dreissena polymorpha]